VPHQARNDVNWSAGFEQLGSYAMPETVNTGVDAARSLHTKRAHCSVHSVFYDVVRQVWFAL
jgi:hypothetical protein